MSDHAEVLVCRSDTLYRAAARAIARLVERKIIEPMPTDSPWSGWPVGGAKRIRFL
jgi:hypothetical protein